MLSLLTSSISSGIGPVFRSSTQHNIPPTAQEHKHQPYQLHQPQRTRAKRPPSASTPYTRFLPSRAKASATVCLSNATTTGCNSTSVVPDEPPNLNAIPFPSAPISIDFPEFDGSCSGEALKGDAENAPQDTLQRNPRPIPRRKRSNCNVPLNPSRVTAPTRGTPLSHLHLQTQRGHASSSRKHPSTTTPGQARPSTKRVRRTGSKRAKADMQFVALVHRSVVAALRLSTRGHSHPQRMDVDSDLAEQETGTGKDADRDGLRGQDEELAQRLWTNLAESGCEPALFIPHSHLQPAPVPLLVLPPGLETPLSSPSADPVSMDVDGLAPTSSCPPTPATSPTSDSSPGPPSTPATPQPPLVLTLSQLVAALILRHHLRARSSTSHHSHSRVARSCVSAGSLRTGYTFPELKRPSAAGAGARGRTGLVGSGSPLSQNY
ncbi:hypothetical protein FIBSPDRAFT_903179 [Athelia psychrophila]|uniref:Uncharacterized protein n=1 Tax=Athelia psychrophila TaxID=1759441 RepID=A0A167WAZ8_9AGAM|nr:hypothetical protein FIBSPDRAFT_903179 [Fibularhizoctonia sp. CBS 109695]